MNIKLPMSLGARAVASLLREVLITLEIPFERTSSEIPYTQIVAVIPLPKCAYGFKFLLTREELALTTYDAKITHAGLIHYLLAEDVTRENAHVFRKILESLVERMPRKPWRFTLGQRFTLGFLAPEVLTAKRKWRFALGLGKLAHGSTDVGKRG
jgi:hypothetical protein